MWRVSLHKWLVFYIRKLVGRVGKLFFIFYKHLAQPGWMMKATRCRRISRCIICWVSHSVRFASPSLAICQDSTIVSIHDRSHHILRSVVTRPNLPQKSASWDPYWGANLKDLLLATIGQNLAVSVAGLSQMTVNWKCRKPNWWTESPRCFLTAWVFRLPCLYRETIHQSGPIPALSSLKCQVSCWLFTFTKYNFATDLWIIDDHCHIWLVKMVKSQKDLKICDRVRPCKCDTEGNTRFSKTCPVPKQNNYAMKIS